MSVIAPYDREGLRTAYRSATPFPHMMIDGFLTDEAAQAAAGAFAPFEQARTRGREFSAVNEKRKVQIVDPTRFPPQISAIADAISAPSFIEDLAYITGIEGLLWDPNYAGGGMHQTDRSGWLDVHVDFNFNEQLQLHRRLNILLYLNPVWDERWGGLLELWNDDVSVRAHAFAPILNRCVVFTTSDISYHGVTAVDCPSGVQRCSFAAYYYTKEAPVGWDGSKHTTIFKARPDEHMKKHVLMPAEAAKRAANEGVRALKQSIKSLIGKNEK